MMMRPAVIVALLLTASAAQAGEAKRTWPVFADPGCTEAKGTKTDAELRKTVKAFGRSTRTCMRVQDRKGREFYVGLVGEDADVPGISRLRGPAIRRAEFDALMSSIADVGPLEARPAPLMPSPDRPPSLPPKAKATKPKGN